MLKTVLLGIWVIVVTAAATYGSVYMKTASRAADPSASIDQGTEALLSEMMSIPVIRGGEVQGYLIMRLAFEADKGILAEKKLEPRPYLSDAAFRVIFASSHIDFRRLRPNDLDHLTAEITKVANERLGIGLIRHVLVQELNYVRKEDIRTNWIGNQKSE